jgi:N-acetylglucosamine kinase-like BadF-type ATPase
MRQNVRKWFLGVDGGQSSTVAVIGDETGAVKGVGKAGPCNHVAAAEARERFLGAIGGAVRAAEEAAGCLEGATGSGDVHQRIHFEAACLGFSGGPHDKEALTREAVRARHYLIANDAHIALTGATGGEPGVIAIAGTGSIAYGRNAAGKTARAGGWGYIFGDEGGAFDLVRQALRAILRHDEGWGAATSLRDTLLHATGARDGNDLLHRFYTLDFPRSRVASYAPLIDEAAREGDHVAREILMSGAQALATYVAAVRRQLFQRGEPSHTSYIGGVFASELFRERFRLIVELEGDSGVHPPKYGPAVGALLEAYKLGGVHEIAHGDHAGL